MAKIERTKIGDDEVVRGIDDDDDRAVEATAGSGLVGCGAPLLLLRSLAITATELLEMERDGRTPEVSYLMISSSHEIYAAVISFSPSV